VSATDNEPVPFPPDFLFGAATAAYQIEGSVHADGRGVSMWDTFSHTAGKTANGDTGDVACDHFRRYDEDLDLMTELGVGAYRFSVSWPRIQPTGKGPASTEGLDFYRRLVDGLRARGILPVLTLYHWDLPQPLQDAGGWPERDTAYRFAEYAATVSQALGDDIGMWITVNEPWCSAWLGYGSGVHAPGISDIGLAGAAHHHLLLGHGEAVAAIRSAVSGAQVGLSLNLGVTRPATNHPDDLAAARRADGNQNRMFLDPLLRGSYPADMLEHYRGREPGFTVVMDGDLGVISRPIDFLGINFYSPGTVADAGRAAEARAAGYCVPAGQSDALTTDHHLISVTRPEYAQTRMGWEIEPAALTELLTRVHEEYGPIPLVVTENGAAFDDYVAPDGVVRDPERISYLDGHLRAVLRAQEAGADVRGYFVWSLLDNFEWALGYSKRFGLIWVDYPTGTRVPKESFRWYAETARSHALAPLPPGVESP
jgi:beta-glucosidase